MKHISFLLLLPLLMAFFARKDAKPEALPYLIPEQRFDIFVEMGYEKYHDTITKASFEISPQVLYSEYKMYLVLVKKDSSEAFYHSQLPDSTMGLPENYREYMTSAKYDNYPVVGVSWDNAMNYLRWRTIRANKDKIYDTIYRLPMLSEWIAANRYFKTTENLKNEMNGNYSDWTMNTKDETYYHDGPFKFGDIEYVYFSKKEEPPVLKRRMAFGNSFHFNVQHTYEFMNWYYYEFHGYAHISFRYVIEVRTLEQRSTKKYPLLKWWGLEK